MRKSTQLRKPTVSWLFRRRRREDRVRCAAALGFAWEGRSELSARGGGLAMLWRDTVAIGVLFGLIGAASTQYLCASPASRKKQARAKNKHERRRRRERQVMSQDSSGEDDSENEARRRKMSPRVNARRASPAAQASSDSSGEEEVPAPPLKGSAKQESSDGKGQTTPVKGAAGQLKMTALSPGSMLRERTLLERVVSQKEAERGGDHPHTLMSKWSLADLLQSKYGDLEGACALARECVAAARRSPELGPEHADTQRYEASRAEWEALRRKVAGGQLVFNGSWSPTKEQCWVPSTGM